MMPAKLLRRQTRRAARRKARAAERELPPREAPARLGAMMSNEALVDGYATLATRHNHQLLRRLTQLRLLNLRLRQLSVRRQATIDHIDELRESGFAAGANHLAPLLFVPAVAAVGMLEVTLGRYVVGHLAPTDGDTAVWLATSAIAALIFAVGHMGATGVLAWVHAGDTPPSPTQRRRSAAMLAVVAAHLALVAAAHLAIGATPQRWVLSYMTVFAAIAVQMMRPNPDVARWAFATLRLAHVDLRRRRLSRRGLRQLGRLCSRHHRLRAYWAGRHHLVNAVLAQNGCGDSPTGGDVALECTQPRYHQHLDVIGLGVAYADIVTAARDLVDAAGAGTLGSATLERLRAA